MSTGEPRAALHGWALCCLYAACASVLLANLGSFLPPVGYRFTDILKPGASDLIPTANAAQALLDGDNPYHIPRPWVHDPYFYSRGQREGISYLYLPSHALVYVPLTWLARGDYEAAIRWQFVLSLACILALAWLVVRLLRGVRLVYAQYTTILLPTLCLVLGLNPGNMLGVERGQSDLLSAVLVWLAVLCFSQRRLSAAAFLAVAATLLKGYGVLFGAGIILLGLLESWRRTLLGALSALVCLLLPVLRYLPDAIEGYRVRGAMFWTGWTNQGFANLALSLGLPRDPGRLAFTAVALMCTVVTWLSLLRTFRGHDARKRYLWSVAFATTSLTSVIGYSLNSISYATIIVLPGALVLLLAQDQLMPRLSEPLRHVLGFTLMLTAAALFLFDPANALGLRSSRLHIPLTAAGELVIVVVVALSALLSQQRQPSR